MDKTMSNSMILSKDRYKHASNEILSQYPTWKKNAVIQDLQNHINNTYTDQYAKDVILLAENEEISSTE